LHTNGYSLARHVLFEQARFAADAHVPELGTTIGDALLAAHRSYLRSVAPLLDLGLVKGLAHITGGGMTENLPRTLPEGCGAEIRLDAWRVPPVFELIQRRGAIARDEMFRAFNMGVGLVIVCAAADVDRVFAALGEAGERSAFRLGAVVPGPRAVQYV
jgi:phosphoribosylformylglycinamidine cyclo-ligase